MTIPGKEFCPNCLLRVAVVIPDTGKESQKKYPKDTPENRAKKMKEFKVIGMEEVWSLDSRGNFNKKKDGRYAEFIWNRWIERESDRNTADSGLCVSYP